MLPRNDQPPATKRTRAKRRCVAGSHHQNRWLPVCSTAGLAGQIIRSQYLRASTLCVPHSIRAEPACTLQTNRHHMTDTRCDLHACKSSDRQAHTCTQSQVTPGATHLMWIPIGGRKWEGALPTGAIRCEDHVLGVHRTL